MHVAFIRLPKFRLSTILIGFCAGLAAGQASAETLNGKVRSGSLAISNSKIFLYRAGSSSGAKATLLARTTATSQGTFTLGYTAPSDPDAVLYVIAKGGVVDKFGLKPHGRLRFATVLGTGTPQNNITINERTTVATAYAFAQFINGVDIGGVYPGPQNAALTLRNLVDLGSGAVGTVLATKPNGGETQTMGEFNSLANLLSSCVRERAGRKCGTLFALAKPPGGKKPTNTLDAMVNIAHYPGQNVADLYDLSTEVGTYSPALNSAVDTWTLTLLYDGGGGQLDGPGNMVFDSDGTVWIGNNYQYKKSAHTPTCGDTHLIRLTPDGKNYPGAPYTGGGVYGVGFGIAMDPDENVWLGNFGFSGKGCSEPPGDDQTVSKFTPDGVPVSGSPYSDGSVDRVQGLATDDDKSVWFANCGGDTVTVYPSGDHTLAKTFAPAGMQKPFGAAVDGNHAAWFTSNTTNRVFKLDQAGNVLLKTARGQAGIKRPMGIAVDSQNNVWVANSGVIAAPCYFKKKTINKPNINKASVTLITAGGKAKGPYQGGGIYMPWGIAVDGDDNVWIANFGGYRIAEICGVAGNCPPGVSTGEPISPDTGWAFDGFIRITAVQIDASGNVWLANNWLPVPYQTNPGGHSMAVMIGMAAPVKTPVIGPPQKP